MSYSLNNPNVYLGGMTAAAPTAKKQTMPVGTMVQQPQQAVASLVQPAPAPPAPLAGSDAVNPKFQAMDAERAASYDKLRARAQQQGDIAKQTQGEALKRRFAALGNVNSGAYIKAAGIQDQDIDKQTQAAVENVDTQQNNEKFQQNEAEKGRIANQELFDKNQAFQQQVFNDESKFRNLDYQMSKQNTLFNAQTSLANLSDEQLRALGGASKEWGWEGNQANINAILKRLGYA